MIFFLNQLQRQENWSIMEQLFSRIKADRLVCSVKKNNGLRRIMTGGVGGGCQISTLNNDSSDVDFFFFTRVYFMSNMRKNNPRRKMTHDLNKNRYVLPHSQDIWLWKYLNFQSAQLILKLKTPNFLRNHCI